MLTSLLQSFAYILRFTINQRKVLKYHFNNAKVSCRENAVAILVS